MRMTCCSETFIVVNLLLDQEKNQQLLGSFALVSFLGIFIILVALWDQDFLPTFRSKLSALKKQLSWALNQEQEALWGPSAEAFWSDSNEALWVGELPSFVNIAKRLIKALPASDRSEAYTLLVTQLLPEEWPQRPAFVTPSELFEKRVKRLASALQQAPPNQRLHFLRVAKYNAEIRQLSLDSVMLAIACYMQQHPDATPDTPMYWLDLEDLSKWSAMSTADLENEALRRLEELEQWQKLVETDFPEIWDEQYLEHLKVLLNLRAAYYGSFYTAMGELALFLDAVGASFEEIRLCH